LIAAYIDKSMKVGTKAVKYTFSFNIREKPLPSDLEISVRFCSDWIVR